MRSLSISTTIRRTPAILRTAAAAAVLGLAACGAEAGGDDAAAGDDSARDETAARAAQPPSCDELAAIPPDSMEATDSGLRILQREEGTGSEARTGDRVAVHYVGCLTDGTKFDASYDRNEPIEFPLGAGRVITGWDQGVDGMKPGGVRVLRIPPELGYGSRGTPDGPIPPDATLIFHVRLVDIESGQTGGAG